MPDDLTSKQKRRRMREVVERLQRYIATYSDQPDYDLYTDETFIKDILYGIGVALDPNEYRCADGFDKFKPLLRPHIGLPVEPSPVTCGKHGAEYRQRDTLPCPWCVIDELKANRDRASAPPSDALLDRIREIVWDDVAPHHIVCALKDALRRPVTKSDVCADCGHSGDLINFNGQQIHEVCPADEKDATP